MKQISFLSFSTLLIMSCSKESIQPGPSLAGNLKTGTNYYYYDNSAGCEDAVEGEDYGCASGTGSCIWPGAVVSPSHYDDLIDINNIIRAGVKNAIISAFDQNEALLDDYLSQTLIDDVKNGDVDVTSRSCSGAEHIYWVFEDSLNRIVCAFPFKEDV